MPALVRRTLCLLPVAALAAAVGCFGGAHNPGYFPNLIPPGDVIQTHAKPPGGAYFRDFDPKAHKLELTPTQATCKPQGNQVFVATVYDADGQPRRGRRVEWMIDGPGHIVEVDESGWTAGRGYKVNNQYAVSYTNYLEHAVCRGNKDPRDDTKIYPGQTWCVVSSAVPGETVVTAYAPGVFDWEKGRVASKVTWGDNSEFSFPPPATARYGGEAALNTVIRKIAEREGVNPADLRVRYRIAGGVPAELIPPPGVSSARAGTDALDIVANTDGRAPVKVVQMTPKAGRTDIAVEVMKPDPDGVTAGKVVGRSTTSVDWSAPTLAVDVQAPKALAATKEGLVTVTVSNTSKVDGPPALVGVRVDGFDVLPEEQPTVSRTEREMVWNVPALAAGQKKEIRLKVRPNRDGQLTVDALAKSEDGLRATAKSTTQVGAAGMTLRLDPQIQAAVGERVPVKVTVSNPSTVPLDAATAFVSFGSGLEHDTGNAQVEATVGDVPAGESRTITVPLIARQTGKFPVRVSVRSGDLSDQQETAVEVRKPELAATVSGPEKLSPGGTGVFEIGVANRGEVAVPNVTVRASLPPGLTAKRASDGGTVSGPGAVVWRVGDLAANARQVLKVEVTADRTVNKGLVTATASSGDATAKDAKQAALLSVKADATVTVQGSPALLLELADPREPVPVGRRAGYRVVVQNKGTGPAKDVRATVYLPDQYANVQGTGANREVVKPEGNKLIFPVVKEIPAGGTVSLYFEVEGAQAGDARVRAEVTADYVTKPLVEEQSTRVTDRGR